jgi:retron-type reverse transcriptase
MLTLTRFFIRQMQTDELRSQFLRLTNFYLAWREVAANRGCAGVDGETVARFGANADHYLAALQKAIADQTYRSLPLRQILIPKKGGGYRKLGVPTARDRIVQQAMLNVLHPLLDVVSRVE